MVLDEECSDKARLLIRRNLLAPPLFATECANAFWRLVRLGKLSTTEVLAALHQIESSGVACREPVMRDVLAFAIALDHPVYDCVYLALAAAEDIPLVTADRRFLTKARSARSKARIVALSAL